MKNTLNKLTLFLLLLVMASGMSFAVYAQEGDGGTPGESADAPAQKAITDFTFAETSFVYTGQTIEPGVVVMVDGVTLVRDTDYTVTYTNNINAGQASATVKGTGTSYTGEITKPFAIIKANQEMQASADTMEVTVGKTKQVKVTGSVGTLTYKSSSPSIASVSKTGLVKGLKSGSSTITITAAGDANHNSAAAKIKVSVTGIKLTKSNTKVTLSKTSYTYDGGKKSPAIKKITYKGKALKKKTDYKIAYENNVNAGTAKVVITGVKKYSGSFKISYKIKKAKNPMTVKINKTFLDIKETAKITAKKAKGTLSYTSSNKSVATVTGKGVVTGKKSGKVTIKVTAAGSKNYSKATKTFSIKVGSRNLGDSTTTARLSNTSYTYDGSRKTPSVSVKCNGKTLKSGRDYTISYSDNKDAGTAKAVIKGKGAYTGSRTLRFTIHKAEQNGMSVSLPGLRIPLNGTAQVSVSGYIGKLSYSSESPSYARSLGGGRFEGLKKTQNYVTIVVKASGDKNHKPARVSLKVSIS